MKYKVLPNQTQWARNWATPAQVLSRGKLGPDFLEVCPEIFCILFYFFERNWNAETRGTDLFAEIPTLGWSRVVFGVGIARNYFLQKQCNRIIVCVFWEIPTLQQTQTDLEGEDLKTNATSASGTTLFSGAARRLDGKKPSLECRLVFPAEIGHNFLLPMTHSGKMWPISTRKTTLVWRPRVAT